MITLQEAKQATEISAYIVENTFSSSKMENLEVRTDFMTDKCKMKFFPEFIYLKFSVIDYTLYQMLGNSEKKDFLSTGIIEELIEYLNVTEIRIDKMTAESRLWTYGKILEKSDTNKTEPYSALCSALFKNSGLILNRDYESKDYMEFMLKFFTMEITETQYFIIDFFNKADDVRNNIQRESRNSGCMSSIFFIVMTMVIVVYFI